MTKEVTRTVTVRVSREEEFEVEAHPDASINFLENAAFEQFADTQAGWDEQEDSEAFEFKVLRAPISEQA